MAAQPKPHEHGGRVWNKVQHAIGPVARLEFRRDPIRLRNPSDDCRRASECFASRQPPQPFAECVEAVGVAVEQPDRQQFVLLPASVEFVATKRLWRGEQRVQFAQL